MDKKPTIKTIAKLAGVSHVTVSKALRDYPDISLATKEKIKTIASEIGYIPNAFARNLSSNVSSSIGMIVPSIGADTIYNEVFTTISAESSKHGLSVVLGSCNRSIELEKSFCRIMCENRVGALVITSVSSDVSHIKEICKDTVPLIFIGGKTGAEEENCIVNDYFYSGKLAVEHFVGLGHKDIALFVYSPTNKTITQKIQGFEASMKYFGLVPRVYWKGDNTDTFNAGKILTEELIAEKKLPSAIWCASDLMALGVLDTLKAYNILVPRDVSLMGHDDMFIGRMPFISLTTIGMPKKEIGVKTVEIALSLMNEPIKNKTHKYVFKPHLIIRNSTDICSKFNSL
ncbi:LacI family DNA-binding transcriptional regulator [Alkaliphilus peptidifermentans]|uniref:Transcriptional regulator, LacI family n=1 Tax=Alkaliphilus peptidifermentans DSM 18978 TaxID=1120976 RepID=A0A1G5K7R2_9FIRM|nr:LacI family DNA-binding transcriptional regulator [Alkaliphilus peptidifermentans]SCY96645.1 transcriptional regulator, LacI family [Alkaliphilus peptidifermentans DSM 18978]